jgi:hypothetical protein
MTPDEKKNFEEHIAKCDHCADETEKAHEMVERITNLKKGRLVREDILNVSRRNIMKKVESYKSHGYKKRFMPLSAAAAGLLVALFTLAGSFIAFPVLAERFAPQLPVVKELLQTREENKALLGVKEQSEELRQKLAEVEKENEQLKIQIKEISGEKMPEVQTGTGVSPEENSAIQEITVNFIKAQYKGDLNAIKAVSTERYLKEIERQKSSISKNNSGSVVFSQITTVAKENDMYLVFVRISDSKSDSEYQENFELKKVNGKFMVDFMGMDA